jgi:glycosyltransferase involved in cell wall biosynthesis
MVNLKVSVVIPSYNSGPGLETCLVALNHQRSALIEQFEVVVVDDGSDDGTEDLVKRLRCDYDLSYVFIPRGPASGRSAARNVGIRAATGELVVMIDADVVVPPGFLAAHLDYHRRRPDLVVTGQRGSLREGPVDHHQLRRAFTMDALPPVAGTDPRGSVFRRLSDNMNFLATCWHYMFSCNVSLRREHLVAVDGFDESFTGWGLEDSELGYRLRRHGLAFAYHPGASLYHQRRQLVDETMYADWRTNLSRFVEKYRDDPAAADVGAQWIFDPAFDPTVTDLSWVESARRFEYAARALHGRLPGAEAYELVEIGAGNRDEVLATLADRMAAANLVVLDDVADDEAAALVQCTRTDRRTAYFRRPAPDIRAQVLAEFGLATAGAA